MRFRPLLLLPLLLLLACGEDSAENATSSETKLPPKDHGGAGGVAGSNHGASGGTAGQGGSIPIGGNGGSTQSTCDDGAPCKDDSGNDGICAGNTCCATSLACGPVCCGAEQVCSFQKCITPGIECKDASDCGENSYCETALAISGTSGQGGAGGAGGEDGSGGNTCIGQQGLTGRCLPLPPLCSDGQGAGGGPITCLQKCERKPSTKPFEVELKYTWGSELGSPTSTDVMMAPLVIQLDDDDCDGKITERDIPEIVFMTFAEGKYNNLGTLHAISVVNEQVVDKWSLPGVIRASSELAAGNFDGEPGNEIVGCDTENFLHAIRGDGTELWKSSVAAPGCHMPSIADLDGDGQPEIFAGNAVFDGKTGALKVQLSANTVDSVALDLDGDGKVELVTPTIVFDAQGQVLADTKLTAYRYAVGDLDNNGIPEIIAVDNASHQLHVWHYDPLKDPNFTVIRQGIDINGTLDPNLCPAGSSGNLYGGGPPTIADFNGDGVPDIALAGGVGYAVFDGKKIMDTAVQGSDTFLWVKQTQDCSSAVTGSSLFDFNGDGKAEVLYADETHFRIYEGATGEIQFETCNTSGTLFEFPIVADVNNDGQADIVIASNAYSSLNCDGTKTAGIRIFGSKNNDWVRTRRIWNQHPYHVTNVNEDGSIPAVEPPNWKQPGLNNFRQNKQPGLEFAAPDATIAVRPACNGKNEAIVEVRNIGQSALAAGAQITLSKGPPPGTTLAEKSTSQVLYPGQAELLTFTMSDPEILSGKKKIFATVTTPPETECRTDNNESSEVIGTCASQIQ